MLTRLYVAFSFLLRLLPGGSSQVSPLEVVISGGVLGSVLLKLSLVASERCLAQLEGLLSLLHAVVTRPHRRLKRLLRLVLRLEVHPVLRSLTEFLLLKRNRRQISKGVQDDL